MKYYLKSCEISQEIWDSIKSLEIQNSTYEQALTLIAAPIRPDGTYNRDRKACEVLAHQTLTEGQNLLKKNIDNTKLV